MFAEDFVDLLYQAERRIGELEMRGPLENAAKGVCKAVDGNFQRQEDSSGVPWKPHSPVTKALHGEHPLLRLSYDLFHASTELDDPNGRKTVSDREIVFGVNGTEIPYAKTQQEGSTKKRIPAREFFYLRGEDAEAIAEQFAEDVKPIIEKEVFQP